MGIVRDLYYARKMGAGVNVPAPDLATYIHRKALAPKSKTYGPADIVSFEAARAKKLKELTVTMSPIQDLHGYDEPWPAGGGKNKIALNLSPVREQILSNTTITEQTEQKLAFTSASATYACVRLFYHLKAGTYTMSLSASSSDSFTPVASVYLYASPYTLLANNVSQSESKSFTLSEDSDIDIRFFATTSTAEERTVSFYNVQLESGSPATSYAPYENLCPITGRTGASAYLGAEYDPDTATLYSCTFPALGKNLLPTQTITKNGNTYYVDSADTYFSFKAGTYAASNTGTMSYMYWRKKGTSDNNVIHGNSALSGTFTLAEDCEIRFWFYSTAESPEFSNIQIEKGSSATAYEPYTNTVYSGTIDLVTGELTVKPTTVLTLDGTESVITSGKSGSFFSAHIANNAKPVSANTDLGEVLSNELKTMPAQTNSTGTLSNVAINTSGRLIVSIYGATTLTEWRNFIAEKSSGGNPIKIYYVTNAEPLIYQLTPQEISSLVGQNNIWSPDGQVTVRV